MQTNAPSPCGRAAAFFDLDRTLIEPNSALLYARAEYRAGRIGARHMLESIVWTGLYHLALIPMERAYTRALRHYRGHRSEDLLERTRAWFEAEIAHLLLPGAREALEWHRGRGEPTVLLTSSSCYLAQLVTEAWGLDAWLANSFSTDESGCLIGQVEPPLCYGAGKVVWAERWAEKHGIDLDASTFYTDSLSDLPMLERVGQRRVVNPDPRLRRLALRRGWPILDWRTGLPAGAPLMPQAEKRQ
jgi:HAD superfamily hydrolase (TIGR01490 family)